MNPFAKYRYINAEEIIKANIRPNYISEDASSLLNALKSVTYIANSDSQKVTNLHRNVIQKLTPKPHTLEILKRLGYVTSKEGQYVYERASEKESITRENAANEFQLFYNDLKKIKAGTLKGFEEYIQTFEDFDVKEQVMSDSMNKAMATSTPTDAVHDLLRQIADENNLDIRAQLDAIPTVTAPIKTREQEEVAAQSSRLATLRHAT